MRWIIAVLVAVAPSNLFAQSAEPRGYLFGGVSVPRQQGVTTDESRTYLAAPGGWSIGFLVGGGARLTNLLSLEAEWHRTGIMEAIEPSRYFITYSARRRDTILSVGARVHLRFSRRLAVEPVGLFEFVGEQSWLAQRRESPGLPPAGNLSDYSPYVDSWGKGLAGGVDLRVGGRHVAALPGVRIHRFWRGENVSGTWPGGRANWEVAVLVAGRIDF